MLLNLIYFISVISSRKLDSKLVNKKSISELSLNDNTKTLDSKSFFKKLNKRRLGKA